MSIAEAGGPTTQAGIVYQNSVAALYLGRMLDPKFQNKRDAVVEVRVEAPEEVDDLVVTYANGGKEYFQVKESVSKSNSTDSAWGKLWRDFGSQFLQPQFNQETDKLILYVGEYGNLFQNTRDLCRRVAGSNYEEWQGRLTAEQIGLLSNIKGFLPQEILRTGESLVAFFACLQVEIAPRDFVETEKVTYWIPESNVNQETVFSLLRDLVGGEARVRGTHKADALQTWLLEVHKVGISPRVETEQLRSAIQSCSSVMRHQRNTIGKTGIHIRRNLSQEITKWLLETTDEAAIGVLLDQAGMGKTVLMREVLEELESRGVDVLAIKADQQLSGVKNLEELPAKLALPVSVERLAWQLASSGKLVVLIDQIDALSISMAHDQKALSVSIDLVSRLRSIPGVRVLISCRRFDFHSDPRLKSIDGSRTFALTEFANEEIQPILASAGIDFGQLLPSTQRLIKNPLHLKLFFMALESEGGSRVLQGQGFLSLQELYHHVWEHVVLKPTPDGPPAWQREQTVLLMVEHMNAEQKITVPKSMFTKQRTSELEPAVKWLLSEGIILGEGGKEYSFFHQTFFDYCYSRDFVEKGGSLAESLLESPQGLFQRPQMVQVLSYLRGLDDSNRYVQQLMALFNTESLRFHLKNHLHQWFAALSGPTELEWRLMQRVASDPKLFMSLLELARGNAGWFVHWKDDVLPTLLNQPDGNCHDKALDYLYSIVEYQQDEVIQFLSHFYESPHLKGKIGNLVTSIRVWKCQEAVQLLERVMAHDVTDTMPLFHWWEELAGYDPDAVTRLLKNHLEKVLSALQTNEAIPSVSSHFSMYDIEQGMNKLEGMSLEKAIDIVIQSSVEFYLDEMIPWLVAAIKSTGSKKDHDSYYYFKSDLFYYNWYDRMQTEFDDVFKESLIHALLKLAKEQRDSFLRQIQVLSECQYQSAQFLVAKVLREVPEEYAEVALQFLLSDPRRLLLGERDNYESRQLIKAILPFLSPVDRLTLETFIIEQLPLAREFGRKGFVYRDKFHLGHLQSFSITDLSVLGKKRLLELKRKFPGYEAPEDPRCIRGGCVESPIHAVKASKMSVKQWINAMKKYERDVRHEDWFKGGARELSLVLQEVVKEEPIRTFGVLEQFKDSTDPYYITSFLNGLAESKAPRELLFRAVEHVSTYKDHEIKKAVARLVEKNAYEGAPEEVVSLLYSYFNDRSHRDDLEIEDAFTRYINTVRGTAMRALMKIFNQDEVRYLQEKWEVISSAVRDESVPLRAGAIYELISMVRHHRERAIDLFEIALSGHPELYQMMFTDDFCYRAMMFKPFRRIYPHLLELMNQGKEELQQSGAELICIALLKADLLDVVEEREEVEKLFEVAMNDRITWRRGVAKTLAAHLVHLPSSFIVRVLCVLMNDEDEVVQKYVAGVVLSLYRKHTPLHEFLRIYLNALVSSKAVIHCNYYLGKVLWKFAGNDPKWVLHVIQTLMTNEHLTAKDIRYSSEPKDLIQAVINIYTDPFSDETLQNQAMDTFDQLMEQFAGSAQSLLSEWDRR